MSSNAQSLWHGSIETSTDTLVPVIESTHTNENSCTKSCTSHVLNDFETAKVHTSKSFTDNVESNSDYLLLRPNSSQRLIDGRQRNLSEVHSKLSNGGFNQMDESIVMQPEHQRMDIVSNRLETLTSNCDISTIMPLHRKRRNSSNSKQPVLDLISPMGQLANRTILDNTSPSATISSRFALSSTRTLPITPNGSRPPIAPSTSMAVTIACPDGLAHALSEQNLRLQQIVHDHKVRLNSPTSNV